MSELLATIRRLRKVPRTDLRLRVRRVAVMLTSSRSGSTLLKEVLSQHPDIASLDGELEPLLVLTENGFRFNSGSDAISRLANHEELGDQLMADLTLPSAQLPSPAELRQRWERRLLLQFPTLFAEAAAYGRLGQSLDKALAKIDGGEPYDEDTLQRLMLAEVFRHEAWRMRYYDGHGGIGAGEGFDEPCKIEEPPFVLPRSFRRPFSEEDAESKVLLFKTPSDAYRIGMYEQLFPNARIQYLHLTRGYAQSVNGLMDGWLSAVGFFAHDLARCGVELAIAGYSDACAFGRRWWKFDLPPNWRDFTSASLEEVCLNQWLSAHRAILASGVSALRIAFEQFLAQPARVMEAITDHLNLPPLRVPAKLPVKMATEMPAEGRWRKREGTLLALARQEEVRAMMAKLGYGMKTEDWR